MIVWIVLVAVWIFACLPSLTARYIGEEIEESNITLTNYPFDQNNQELAHRHSAMLHEARTAWWEAESRKQNKLLQKIQREDRNLLHVNFDGCDSEDAIAAAIADAARQAPCQGFLCSDTGATNWRIDLRQLYQAMQVYCRAGKLRVYIQQLQRSGNRPSSLKEYVVPRYPQSDKGILDAFIAHHHSAANHKNRADWFRSEYDKQQAFLRKVQEEIPYADFGNCRREDVPRPACLRETIRTPQCIAELNAQIDAIQWLEAMQVSCRLGNLLVYGEIQAQPL